MIRIDKCEFIETRHAMVDSATTKLDEGVFLVHALENGKAVVKASTGVADEKFIGVSFSKHMLPATAVQAVETTVPTAAPYEIMLPAIPVEIGVFIDGAFADGSGVAAGNYDLDPSGKLILDAADSGKPIAIQYRYNLTVAQANALFGGDGILTDLSNVEISIMTTGLMVTDQYVLTDDWSDETLAIKLAADGRVTNDAGATGTELDAVVELLPSVNAGFLGLRIKP